MERPVLYICFLALLIGGCPAPNSPTPKTVQQDNSDLTNEEFVKLANENPDAVLESPLREEATRRVLDVLAQCADSHPWRVIREDMLNHVLEGRLHIGIAIEQDLLHDRRGAMQFIRTPEGDVARIELVLQSWLDPRTTDQQRSLTIAHEYVHFLQIQQRPDLKPLFHEEPSEMTPDRVHQYLDLELEAYLIESKLAVDQGWEAAFPRNLLYKQLGWSELVREITDQAFLSIPLYGKYRSQIIQLRDEYIARGEPKVDMPR